MSKAFLRESDFDDSPEPPAPAALLPPGTKNLLTARGAARLRDALTALVEHERPRLADRSDDPEAKRELRSLDQRIRQLEQSLRTAEIVPPAPVADGVIRFGHTVTVRDRAGAESTYQLVGVDEADVAAGRVSWMSPLARALLNARVGGRVSFQAPSGLQSLEIVSLESE